MIGVDFNSWIAENWKIFARIIAEETTYSLEKFVHTETVRKTLEIKVKFVTVKTPQLAPNLGNKICNK